MASTLESLANAKFVDEEYEEAVDLYTEGLSTDPLNASLLVGRAAAHLKLENYTDAVADANRAIQIDSNFPKAYLRKGIACFHLEEYSSAKSAFEIGASLENSNSQFKKWIQKCVVELQAEELEGSQSKPFDQSRKTEPKGTSSLQEVNIQPPDKVEGLDTAVVGPQSQPLVEQGTYRHEWYQTPKEVVITLFAKGLTSENVLIDFGDQKVEVVIRKDGSSVVIFQKELFGKIVSGNSRFAVLKTKVEIRLVKAESIQWKSLDHSARSGVDQPINVSDDHAREVASLYPTSSKRRTVVDWDKFEAEVKSQEDNDKGDGEAALTKMFQDIYRNADEDTRRAMNKSFVESNGSVLSTNWKDVGKRKVEPHK